MSIHEDLKAYLDGELPASRAHEVETAIAANAELRKEVEAMKAISSTFRLAQVDAVPVGLEATLAALAKAKPAEAVAPKRNWMIPMQRLAFAAAAVLVLFAVAPLFTTTKEFARREAPLATGFDSAKAPMSESQVFRKDLVAPSKAKKMLSKAENGGSEASDKTAVGFTNGSTSAQPSAAAPQPVEAAPAFTPNNSVSSDVVTEPPKPESAKDETVSAQGAVSPPLAKSDAALAAPTKARNSAPAVRKTLRPSAAKQAQAAPMARMVVMNCDLGVYVKDVAADKAKAERLTKSVGGYVESSEMPDKKEARLVMRVPVDSYQSVVDQLRAMGEVNLDQSSGRDVTEEAVSTESRLKTLQGVEREDRNLLKQAQDQGMDQVLQAKQKVDQDREQINALRDTSKALHNQAALSTIRLDLSVKPPKERPVVAYVPEKPEEPGWLGSTVVGAVDAFMVVARVLMTIFIYLFTFSPIWLPAVLLSIWGYKMSRPQYRY